MAVRDNVAILEVAGPLFKRANLFVHFSGATSYEILRRDLQAALDDRAVDAIMIKVDSPGGEANGCDELAAAIYAARGRKPIHAFVSGMACSGGYWIASAADRMIVSDLAVLGSIGVVLGIADRKKADERAGITRVDFVSSQSPGKRPDVETDEGRQRVQKMVDDLAAVFVSAVAKHRNVSAKTVVSKFGSGGVEIGANAVGLGMADEVGQFETALQGLSARGRRTKISQSTRPSAATHSPLPLAALVECAPSNPTAAGSVSGAIPIGEVGEQTVASVRERYRAFSAIEERSTLPTLHAHLRDRTSVSAREGGAVLKATANDLQRLSAGPVEDLEIAYLRRKIAAGAIGLEGYKLT
ncbi:Putative signal peptide peptidase SppA [Aminobacter sp. MSH1]|uniref:S49 family peptidase n=1 Tax=Aminobacter sp. MSH1 TaxID=374606 RepID=UPI000D50551A|nr:S49 family peptidase [Aminobacter sp. MSH1]AWC22225.1 Putative signal peptide peptidase SppA [Aminobacter sp. MSH1]